MHKDVSFLVISVCFSCFQLASIEIKIKLVGLVDEVHKWPAALTDSQTDPSVKHYGSIVGTACEYRTCAREILVVSHSCPEKSHMLTRSVA